MTTVADAERRRLADEAARIKNWKRWGPYLSERQWGTVREDYSKDGSCWSYFPHDHARSRAYRWGEDGLLGFCDRQCRLCFAVALWNEQDPILKERLFGLTGPEGNHGEDVKELYYYLDSTPTHSYAKVLYKYPQRAFPYAQLVDETARRGKHDPEFELLDTGVFDDDRYFDVYAEYAKASPNDLLIRLTVVNRGAEAAPLHLLPTLWFRNTWVWGCEHEGCTLRPDLRRVDDGRVETDHETLGKFIFTMGPAPDGNQPELLCTDNTTNYARLFQASNLTRWVKDAFHQRVVRGKTDAINPRLYGTKCAPWYRLRVPPGGQAAVHLRLFADTEAPSKPFGRGFDETFVQRRAEADAFYDEVCGSRTPVAEKQVMRQACASLLWSKQFYHYVVEDWLKGDPHEPTPPPQRKSGRNQDWGHLFSRDVISMPDKWEYPWFAAWDLAFHMIPFARLDPDFAKRQLMLFLREWYMHPNGQIPAYEFAFNDVNPPVHAWACWRIFKMSAPRGQRDRKFLAGVFQKLLVNFTWWVNRKDPGGNHLFSGGFLGLDNIGVFDRNLPMPGGGHLQQADGTAWMAFYCLTMLAMAVELAQTDHGYSDMASKFFEHFVHIADAMNTLGGTGLWDEDDGFYYDQVWIEHEKRSIPIKVRSLVGLLPMIAVETFDCQRLEPLTGFRRRTDWFLKYRADLGSQVSYMNRSEQGQSDRFILAMPSRQRLERVLRYLFDENEFLSPYGIRSLSKVHENQPYSFHLDGTQQQVRYTPGESDTNMFGGNSNWRGPIWFPTNYLLIEALQRYHHFYGDSFQVEFPTGSGQHMSLADAATQIQRRLASLFLADEQGVRPCHGPGTPYEDRPAFRDLLLFHEYFHGDSGLGLGASHQTGWTALVARCFARMD